MLHIRFGIIVETRVNIVILHLNEMYTLYRYRLSYYLRAQGVP